MLGLSIIRSSRYATHLVKCMRNYEQKRIRNPNLPEITPCEYNWLHHVEKAKYDEHIKMCPDALKHYKSIQEIQLEWAQARKFYK